jgi:hypothetical protein
LPCEKADKKFQISPIIFTNTQPIQERILEDGNPYIQEKEKF